MGSTEYAYFFFYSFVRNAYLKRAAARLPKGAALPALGTAAELLLGAIAGALAQIFTIPVAVIATRQQIGRSDRASRQNSRKPSISYAAATAAPSSSTATYVPPVGSAAAKQPIQPATKEAQQNQEDADDSFLTVAREIVEEEGVGGLWLGIKPGLVLTVNPAITYGAYERIKNAVLSDPNAKLSPGRAFAVGALSKTLATIVSNPLRP